MNKKFVLDTAVMQRIDTGTIEEIGISQDVLMERAALGLVERIVLYHPKKVLCVCGTGNNGGDGIATARILHMEGMNADVYLCKTPDKCKDSVCRQLEIFQKTGGRRVTDLSFFEYDIIVDAIFGIGLDREISGEYADVIAKINAAREKGSKVIAADIPSGIHAEKGTVLGTAVRADETVTFAYYKPGHLLYPGADYCGKVSVKPIGIRFEPFYSKQEMKQFTIEKDNCDILPKRPKNGNKGTFGRVLVIAGSSSMYGACYLSALAAFRIGAGLVNVFTHEVNRLAIQTMLPEAILQTYEDTDSAVRTLPRLLQSADCVVVGPGLSTNDTAMKIVQLVLNTFKQTIVADADALNCIAKQPELRYNLKQFEGRDIIMTPHLGELARLTGKSINELKNDFCREIHNYAGEYGVILVGKDARTVVSDGNNIYINQTGNDGMATAGSGDVLSGIIAGLCAQKENAFDAALKGVFLHGKAGDLALQKGNAHALMAQDIANAISLIK